MRTIQIEGCTFFQWIKVCYKWGFNYTSYGLVLMLWLGNEAIITVAHSITSDSIPYWQNTKWHWLFPEALYSKCDSGGRVCLWGSHWWTHISKFSLHFLVRPSVYSTLLFLIPNLLAEFGEIYRHSKVFYSGLGMRLTVYTCQLYRLHMYTSVCYLTDCNTCTGCSAEENSTLEGTTGTSEKRRASWQPKGDAFRRLWLQVCGATSKCLPDRMSSMLPTSSWPLPSYMLWHKLLSLVYSTSQSWWQILPSM